jgi:hypothetical protein
LVRGNNHWGTRLVPRRSQANRFAGLSARQNPARESRQTARALDQLLLFDGSYAIDLHTVLICAEDPPSGGFFVSAVDKAA